MRAIVLPLILALGMVAPPGAMAERGRELHVAQAGDTKPLGDVLSQIGKRYPGRALDAKKIERGGEPAYAIKWLGEDGQVREIVADARTGEILDMR